MIKDVSLRVRLVQWLAVSGVIALMVAQGPQLVEAQSRQDAATSVQSLVEAGERLLAKDVSARTGFITFATTPNRGLLLPQTASAPAEERALGFVDLYGMRFGLADRSHVRSLRASTPDELGITHVRLQQQHLGVPVRGAEFLVHLRGSRVIAANGHIIDDLPDDVIPALSPNLASIQARALIQKHRPELAAGAQYSDPQLEIFSRGVLLSEETADRPRLAWFIEATGPGLREYIWVDAASGGILLNFSQLADAKSRFVYTASGTRQLPGTLMRAEGQPATGDLDADVAYTYSGAAYDYFASSHGRDSLDNAGSPLVSTVHYGFNFSNAYWDGNQMVYGDGFASADDVVAHELTHGVTERTAGLLYYVQSGALNESYSDIFGETVDLLDSLGDDSTGVRWEIGEDLPIGAIRNLMIPNSFGDPGKMSDAAQFFCTPRAWTEPTGDNGGVHVNSGIPNHAYALMVDGGSYNGRTISGIGLEKAGKIQYRALTVYLTSGASFLDDYHALNQSCTDLIGTAGITSSDCSQVTNALQAVEMNSTWACPGATPPPAMCPTGTPITTTLDTFETGNGNWTPTTTSAAMWSRDSGFAKSGTFMQYGSDESSTSDHQLSMTTGVVIPNEARMYFDHAFEFESDFASNYYDAGVMEYSTNNGSTWADASRFFDAGQAYNGIVVAGSGNVLGSRSAFVSSSYGYTGTRLNLSSLAGESVKFRFRIGTDVSVGSLGWVIDNVAIYSCGPPPTPPVITAHPRPFTTYAGHSGAITFTAAASGTPAPTTQWQISADGGVAWSNIAGATGATYSFTPGLSDNGQRFRAVFTNSAGTATTDAALLTVLPFRRLAPGDLDNDGRSDLVIWRPGTGAWHSLGSATGYSDGSAAATQWGAMSDVSLLGDVDGDGQSDFLVWRPVNGTWYWLTSSSGYSVMSAGSRQWGNQGLGDVPIVADVDGDGKSDLVVWRASTGTWHWLTSSSGYGYAAAGSVQWGNQGLGDVPLVGDFDGDGRADLAVWRPSTGTWHWLTSSSEYSYASPGSRQWGNQGLGDVPRVGDFDGDGRSDLVVWRASTGTWYWLTSLSGFSYASAGAVQWGNQSLGDTPLLGDFDGDGRADMSVWRASTGVWFWLTSSSGYAYKAAWSKQWGNQSLGDVPMVK